MWKGMGMIMMTPRETLEKCQKNMKPEWKLAFGAAFVLGLLIHLPVMLSDTPNHDGLSSMYFDQNMITSGRWFLTVACGISSYFTLPWLIGLLSLLWLGCAAAALTELLEIRDRALIVGVSGLLVAFPAAASTFAYVYTMDGYMMALLLAVLAVLFTKKYKKGFLPGALCLAFSMGIYQSYLPFAVILSLYMVLTMFMEEIGLKEKLSRALHYLCMGAGGVVLYYVILQILLAVQGKELDTYQGISGMSAVGGGSGASLMGSLAEVYRDFTVFTVKGNVLCNNVFSLAALLVLAVLAAAVLISLTLRKKWWKSPLFYGALGVGALGFPVAANVILIVSPQVNYHLLMRYQWVLFLILMAAFVGKYGCGGLAGPGAPGDSGLSGCRGIGPLTEWLLTISVLVLVFNYAVMDNIAYSNLEKRYEKTYAYCVRLLDRIEQTPGYYQGIPIAIVGVVGYEEFPVTDITLDVTGGMIGIGGDTLLYTAENYEAFMKNYLGATLNFLDVDTVGEIYYSEEYIAMDSFPGENSVKLVDGVIYVKTENATRD